MKNQFKILCVAMALATPMLASAATTWTLTASPAGVTVGAYANTGGTNNAANAANNGALQTIQNATLNAYSGGYGITNADVGSGTYDDTSEGISPEHAIDNNQRYDMALLTFDAAVKLTNLKLGWTSTDSDVTVMAYIGAGAPTLVGKTYDQLVGLGWASIGNYADIGTSTTSINAGGTFSSYWLIGAYNPLAAGSVSANGGALGVGNDYVKLASVTGDTCVGGSGPKCSPPGKVPEPGSLALFGLALLGVLSVRKRQQA